MPMCGRCLPVSSCFDPWNYHRSSRKAFSSLRKFMRLPCVLRRMLQSIYVNASGLFCFAVLTQKVSVQNCVSCDQEHASTGILVLPKYLPSPLLHVEHPLVCVVPYISVIIFFWNTLSHVLYTWKASDSVNPRGSEPSCHIPLRTGGMYGNLRAFERNGDAPGAK